MELDHAVIRILAAIEREQCHPADEEEGQAVVDDIRTSFREESDDIAGQAA